MFEEVFAIIPIRWNDHATSFFVLDVLITTMSAYVRANIIFIWVLGGCSNCEKYAKCFFYCIEYAWHYVANVQYMKQMIEHNLLSINYFSPIVNAKNETFM